jgi:hypothetical protein
MTIGAVNGLKNCLRNTGGHLPLFGVWIENVRGDTKNKNGLLDLGQSFCDRVITIGRNPSARDIVSVDPIGHSNIAVCVEASVEFLRLVSQVAVDGHFGRRICVSGCLFPD